MTASGLSSNRSRSSLETKMNDTEESYRKEWATLTGRSESDIYIPEALREEKSDDE